MKTKEMPRQPILSLMSFRGDSPNHFSCGVYSPASNSSRHCLGNITEQFYSVVREECERVNNEYLIGRSLVRKPLQIGNKITQDRPHNNLFECLHRTLRNQKAGINKKSHIERCEASLRTTRKE